MCVAGGNFGKNLGRCRVDRPRPCPGSMAGQLALLASASFRPLSSVLGANVVLSTLGHSCGKPSGRKKDTEALRLKQCLHSLRWLEVFPDGQDEARRTRA